LDTTMTTAAVVLVRSGYMLKSVEYLNTSMKELLSTIVYTTNLPRNANLRAFDSLVSVSSDSSHAPLISESIWMIF
jgi:hypothetical protein